VRLRNTVYHWARVATQHDHESRTRYAALRRAGTHTDAPSAVSQTDSLQWRASSCNDRLCLTLISASRPHHKAAFFVPSRQPMFLSSTTGPFLRPDLPDSTAPRTEGGQDWP